MLWNGYKTKIGYGHARIMSFMMPEEGYKQILIHRAAYMLKIKQTSRPPIPEGLEVSHLCNDKACANPEHLTLQTLRSKMSQTVIDTNKQDMQAKRSMVKEANIREHPPVTQTPDI